MRCSAENREQAKVLPLQGGIKMDFKVGTLGLGPKIPLLGGLVISDGHVVKIIFSLQWILGTFSHLKSHHDTIPGRGNVYDINIQWMLTLLPFSTF